MKTARQIALALSVLALTSTACGHRSTLPASLDDQAYWSLIESLSEPPGNFTLSENVVSNEPHFANTVRSLRRSGGVYLGVGPEQNFSYIAGLRPKMAFIVDIRRENLDLHLLYKALFELSNDRADFVSRLFSRPRPAGLTTSTSVDEIFARFDAVQSSTEYLASTATLVRERLVEVHRFPLSQDDRDWIDHVLQTFYVNGPRIDYYGSRSVDTVRPSYRALMTSRDFAGQSRSFLATENAFAFVKALQGKNMIVPVVGDFAGPTALRRVGDYVRGHSEQVQVMYGSNVGAYLSTLQTYAFCRNLETLPASYAAWFMDSHGFRSLHAKLKECRSGQRE